MYIFGNFLEEVEA